MLNKQSQYNHLLPLVKSVALLLILLACIPNILLAQEPAAKTAETTKPRKQPIAPKDKGFDWVQLKNGEWLKGEIVELQERDLAFDSDKFKLQDIDLDDVYALYLAKENICLFVGNYSVTGVVQIEGKVVTIETKDGQEKYSREDLRTIIPGGDDRWDFWSLKISLGSTFRTGNIEQNTVSTIINIERRNVKTKTTIDYRNSYENTDGQDIANNQLGQFRHDIFMTRDIFWVLPSIQYYSDQIQNIKHRITPFAGLGYYFINNKKAELNLTTGAGYEYTLYDSVEPDEDTTASGATIVLGTNLDWELTDDIDLKLGYNGSFGLSDNAGNNHNAQMTFSFEIVKDFDLDISFIWDHVDNTQSESDTEALDQNDIKMTIGIGVEF